MKHIKILFIFILSTCFLFITQNIYATENSEDLTLSRIYVEPGTLDPEFSETRDYYTLLLDLNVTNLIVQATPTNESLKYEIKGNENIKEGENIITITVYSEDNSKTKVYTINALKTEEPDKYNTLLSTLIVDNYTFNEEFFPEKFLYTLKDNVYNNELEVFAYPKNSNASVKVEGNTNLKDGENTITITVTSENGLAKQVYNIYLYKGEKKNQDMTTISKSNEILNNTDNSKFITFIIISTIIIIILIFIMLITRNK